MHFCLASANRDAPGPQIWRHINPADVAKCKTDILTLSAASTEQWKLRIDDQSWFGDDIAHKAASDKGKKFMDVDGNLRVDDELAKEDVAGGWDLY